MNKKGILFSEYSELSHPLRRFKEESERMGVGLDIYKFSDLILEFSQNSVKVIINGDANLFDNYDFYLFRNPKSEIGSKFHHYTKMLKYLANKEGKRILNYSATMNHYSYHTKLYNYTVLAKNGIPIIPTYNFSTIQHLLDNKHRLTFPLIAKQSRGSHGEGVRLLNNFTDVLDYVQVNEINTVLFQEYITQGETKEDFRVITVGNEVLGGYKKVASAGSIVTNLGSGGSAVKVDIDDKLIDIANKIIKAFDIEFSGIDIIYRNDQPLVLEVNKAPEFEGFEKATGINVAGKILEYLTK